MASRPPPVREGASGSCDRGLEGSGRDCGVCVTSSAGMPPDQDRWSQDRNRPVIGRSPTDETVDEGTTKERDMDAARHLLRGYLSAHPLRPGHVRGEPSQRDGALEQRRDPGARGARAPEPARGGRRVVLGRPCRSQRGPRGDEGLRHRDPSARVRDLRRRGWGGRRRIRPRITDPGHRRTAHGALRSLAASALGAGRAHGSGRRPGHDDGRRPIAGSSPSTTSRPTASRSSRTGHLPTSKARASSIAPNRSSSRGD